MVEDRKSARMNALNSAREQSRREGARFYIGAGIMILALLVWGVITIGSFALNLK